MKRITLLLVACTALLFQSFSQTVSWAKSWGANADDHASALAIDGSGNLYMTGGFALTTSFGATSLTATGSNDLFVAKVNNAGVIQWAQQAGGLTGTWLDGDYIAVDATGNVYVAGNFDKDIAFGTTTLTNAGGDDIYIAKYDASGALQWAKQVSGAGDETVSGLSCDATHVIICGSFTGTTTFGTNTFTSAGTDVFLARIDPLSGTILTAFKGGGAGTDNASAMALDNSGNIFLTGIFSSSITFGSTTVTGNNSSPDIFLAQYNATGFVKAKSFGAQGTESVADIAINPAGNIFLIGGYIDSTRFDTVKLSGGSNFLVQLDAAGNAQWASVVVTSSSSGVGNLAVDGAGKAYVTGGFYGSATIGSQTLTSSGFGGDMFVAKFGNQGAPAWAFQSTGTNAIKQAHAIVTDNANTLYIAGMFNYTAKFGGYTLTAPGGSDYSNALLFKISSPTTAIQQNASMRMGLKLYPNPTSGSFSLSIPGNHSCVVKIVDQLGRIVFEREMQAGNAKLDAALVKGLYYVHVYDGSDIHTSALVIE